MGLARIFFDAGNTLIGLDRARLLSALWAGGFRVTEQALRRAESALRRDLDREIIERWEAGEVPRTGWIESRVWKDYWRRVLVSCGAAPDASDPLAERVLQVVRPASSWDRVEPDTEKVLEILASRGYRLGIVSNSSGTLLEHLERIGLARHFDVIVDSSDVGVEKPHPDIFQMAMARAGVTDPARCLHVGDVYAIDVLGATGAGLGAVLFDPEEAWDPSLAPEGAPPCARIRALSDLPALLEEKEGA